MQSSDCEKLVENRLSILVSVSDQIANNYFHFHNAHFTLTVTITPLQLQLQLQVLSVFFFLSALFLSCLGKTAANYKPRQFAVIQTDLRFM